MKLVDRRTEVIATLELNREECEQLEQICKWVDHGALEEIMNNRSHEVSDHRPYQRLMDTLLKEVRKALP